MSSGADWIGRGWGPLRRRVHPPGEATVHHPEEAIAHHQAGVTTRRRDARTFRRRAAVRGLHPGGATIPHREAVTVRRLEEGKPHPRDGRTCRHPGASTVHHRGALSGCAARCSFRSCLQDVAPNAMRASLNLAVVERLDGEGKRGEESGHRERTGWGALSSLHPLTRATQARTTATTATVHASP